MRTLLVLLCLRAPALTAQNPPDTSDAAQTQQLRDQIRVRWQQVVRRQLDLKPDQAARLQQTEGRFETLWRRLSLSVDWRYRYSSISHEARRVSQWSFIQLHRQGLTYTQVAPTLWCPECQTAIAQAEVNDASLPTRFATIAFRLPGGGILPIATTRPELLPACVAIFVHPNDPRYRHLIGKTARIDSGAFSGSPELAVPILADELADPSRGSGAVMCCTFGD